MPLPRISMNREAENVAIMLRISTRIMYPEGKRNDYFLKVTLGHLMHSNSNSDERLKTLLAAKQRYRKQETTD